MSWLHAIVISLLQGAFELFPVSSLGHSVLVPALLNWNEWKTNDPNNASFVAFVVVLHLGTAVALLTFFWRDWIRIIVAVLRNIAERKIDSDPDAHFGWLIVVGTVPAGLLGFLFQHPLRDLFGRPALVALFLVLNGVMMLAGERLRRRQRVVVPAEEGGVATMERGKEIADVGFKEGIAVGTAQALALLPGFSRSGATITGGLLVGLRHKDAARYSFMLATPIILAAAVLEVPKIFKSDATYRGREIGGRLPHLGIHRLSRRTLPRALLRDRTPRSIRVLLHRLRRRVSGNLRYSWNYAGGITMEQLSRSQRMIVVVVAVVLALVFLGNIVYWSAFAPAHPRVKHDVLFVMLTLGSLLLAWFAWPSAQSSDH